MLPEMTPPLPRDAPPPLPSNASVAGGNTSSIPQLMSSYTAQPPPSVYASYYQQYMQWYAMQYAQAGYQAGYQAAPSATPTSTSMATTTATIPPQYNMYHSQAPQAQPKPAEQQAQATVHNNKASAIKFNLKFNANGSAAKPSQEDTLNSTPNGKTSPPNRKSRFDNLSNIAAEQRHFEQNKTKANQQQQPQQLPKTSTNPNPTNNETKTSKEQQQEINDKAAADIVFDIQKWPAALKAYCTKVYQHYQKIHVISEDQVTKYLQQRITDTFKLKPDLNIGWETEPVPAQEDIRKVAPLSQLQISQQKKQEAAIAAAKAKFAQNLAIKQKQKEQQQLLDSVHLESKKRADSKTPKKRKITRSRSSSSSRSSSTSSTSPRHKKSSADDFIALTDHSGKKLNKKGKKNKNNQLKNIQINSSNGKRVFNVTGNSKLEKRLSHKLSISDGSDSQEDDARARLKQQKLVDRQQRFQKSQNSARHCYIAQEDQGVRRNIRNIFSMTNDEISYKDSQEECCVGYCQDLEKEYLRLTGPPEPHAVRPESVLKKSLEFVVKNYNGGRSYRYVCEQLKSIRQDLSVQWIENEFTIEVYETHARIAIKNKDRDEFNQCQSKLKFLYDLVEKTGSKENRSASLSSPKSKIFENAAEFVGYRLLYNMLTKSHNDLNQVIKEIKLKYAGHEYLEHLLALRNAAHMNNYVKFFRLYATSNEMSKCLIDLFIDRVRKLALKSILKSYRPSIKLDYVTEMLAYESVDKCREDLLRYKLIIQSVPIVVNPSDSSSGSPSLSGRTFATNSSNHKFNKPTPNSKNTTKFEEVLDCKQSTLQGF